MKVKRIIKGVSFFISGIASAILGIIAYCLENGFYESAKSYGGDAYTGIQNASAQTANNIIYLADICKFGFGSILLIAGIVFIIFAVLSFVPDKSNQVSAQCDNASAGFFTIPPAKTPGSVPHAHIVPTPATSPVHVPGKSAPPVYSPEYKSADNPEIKQETPSVKGLRYCSECNKSYNIDCDFCPDCGAKLG